MVKRFEGRKPGSGRRPTDIPDTWLAALGWPDVMTADQIRVYLGLPTVRQRWRAAERARAKVDPELKEKRREAKRRSRAVAREEGRVVTMQLGARVVAELRALLAQERAEQAERGEQQAERTVRSVVLELIREGIERRRGKGS